MPSLQGFFDLSGIPLPPGVTTANYQVTFEAINSLYILENSVGPYIAGAGRRPRARSTRSRLPISPRAARKPSPSPRPTPPRADTTTPLAPRPSRARCPSGRLVVRAAQPGGPERLVHLSGARQSHLHRRHAGAGRNRRADESKAMPSIGVWDAFDPVGATAVGAAPGLNGDATGETWLRVATNGDDIVRIGIADLRGDGRPDYAYNGWVLYADTVSPTRLPASGGPITIQGMGFRLADTVLVGGQAAIVTSISPNQITAIAPPAPAGVTGSVDVEVDDQPAFYAAAVIPGGVSYDSGTGDALTLDTAPANTVPIGVPIPFTVTALGPNLAPAGGVTVIYTVTSGTATLACGLPVCSVTATGDGRATMNVTATSTTWSIVTASLTNGSSLQAQFVGGTPPVLSALTPQLSLAAGATFTWTVQALVENNGVPLERPDGDLAKSHGRHRPCQARLRSPPTPSGIATKRSPWARSPRAKPQASTPA